MGGWRRGLEEVVSLLSEDIHDASGTCAYSQVDQWADGCVAALWRTVLQCLAAFHHFDTN
jgi:hypothetical protein